MGMQIFVVDNAIGKLQPQNISVILVEALEGDAFH
jgi:type III secretory pathway lipoprotein EscJ